MKDTVVSGSLRATDSLLSTTAQFLILEIPTSSGGTTYGPGTSGNVLSTNGTSVYWRGVKNNASSSCALGWTSNDADTVLVTSNTIAYWDGRYKADGNKSNLAYCNKGAFGTIVTYAAASANTASTAVVRDASGNFSAGTITASLTGHASSDIPIIWRTSLTKGTIPNTSTSTWNGGHGLFVTGTGTNNVDRLAFLESEIVKNGDHYYYIRAYGFKSGSSTNAYLRLGVDYSNTVSLYTNAPFTSENNVTCRALIANYRIPIVSSSTSANSAYIRFDTRAGTSTLGSSDTVTYTTEDITTLGIIYFDVMSNTNTYATAGNINSTKTVTRNSPRFYFREYSRAASDTIAKVANNRHENYYLPAATEGITSNGHYDIYTTKLWPYNRTTTGSYWDVRLNDSTCASLQLSTVGSAGTEGFVSLILGNNTPKATAKNATGRIYLYNSNGYALTIQGGYGTFINNSNMNYINTNNILVSGHIEARLAGEVIIEAHNSATGGSVLLDSGSGTNHGVYSRGYTPTTTSFTSSGKWMVYRDSTGAVYLNGTAATAQATYTASLSANSSDNTHKGALLQYFNANKSTITRNSILGYYSAAYGNGSMYMGYFLSGYDSNPYGGFFVAHYNTAYYVGISNGTYSQRLIWTKGDAVTGAVWNDYAEYRKCDELPPGACVLELDDGHLIASNKRLIPGASIISDTWGFSQGETEEAKTPIAISGRVLAYTFLPRHMYHAGLAVCSAPGGTIDIMTREEIRDYPDAIIGIVSEIPEYEEWGGGENADRPPVKVNGRIWIKVR